MGTRKWKDSVSVMQWRTLQWRETFVTSPLKYYKMEEEEEEEEEEENEKRENEKDRETNSVCIFNLLRTFPCQKQRQLSKSKVQ